MSRLAFRHEAMATYFEIELEGADPAYGRAAAAAAFRELDRLEGELSRYVESSDISRANRLAAGASTVIGDDAMECLLVAAGVAASTGRAFDPAYASGPGESGAPAFALDPAAHVLTARSSPLRLDLGAVGKGFALDRLAGVLREWGVGSALLNSGGSTALALGSRGAEGGWAVAMGEAPHRRQLRLRGTALSGSGVAVKGAHVVDPRSGRAATRAERAWAHAPNAALADALSTAFFVMSDAEVAAFCAEHEGVGAALARPDGSLALHGTLAAGPYE